MAQTLNLNIAGKHTYNSDLSGVPQGSLKVASNINISRLNIAEPRRGYNNLDYNLASLSDRAEKIIFYNGNIFVFDGSELQLYDSGSGFSSKGSISEPSNATTIREAVISKNLYLSSSEGLKKLDDVTSSIYQAGIPKGTLIELALSSASGTAIENNKYVTYRYLIARKDAQGNTIFGGVSGRYTVFNNGGSTDNVDLTVYIPSGLSTSHFAQIYRSANSSAEPNDELQLAYEYNITSTDISNGYFTFTDIVTDDLLGATIYTAASQEGIANDNTEPPLASDIAVYKNHLFFSDTSSKHRFNFTLIACGGSEGLAVDDTITISDGTTTEVYTAKSSYDGANKYFVVDTASSSPAVRIDNTIKSLIKLINIESALVYSYLTSTGDDDLPGGCLLEARSLSTTEFSVVSSTKTPWSPQLETTSNDNQVSTNDTYKNGIMFSKENQPEAVPLKNIFFVGSSEYRIKRIVPLRDGLFIIKESEGIYVLRGTNESSFVVDILDSTAKIVASESLKVVNNLIYGLFSSGIGEVSDTGVSIISLPIKDEILPLYNFSSTTLDTYVFGVGYEVDGKYILSVPVTSSDTYSSKQHVFDVYGRTFCDWNLELRSGGLNPSDNLLYFGSGTSNKIKVERKVYDYTDFADYGSLCTITAYTGTTVTINNTESMTVGDILVQGDNNAYIESIDVSSGTVVIDTEQAWTLSTADVDHLIAINVAIEWNSEYSGNPAGYKQFFETELLFKTGFQKALTVYYYSDIDGSESSISLEASSGNGAWGEFVWGDEVWGGETGKQPIRLGVPGPKSRCNQLSVRVESRVAYSDFQINGISLAFNSVSMRSAR